MDAFIADRLYAFAIIYSIIVIYRLLGELITFSRDQAIAIKSTKSVLFNQSKINDAHEFVVGIDEMINLSEI